MTERNKGLQAVALLLLKEIKVLKYYSVISEIPTEEESIPHFPLLTYIIAT